MHCKVHNITNTAFNKPIPKIRMISYAFRVSVIMDVVSIKILAGLVTQLNLKGEEYGSMLRDSSTFDVFVFVLQYSSENRLATS